MPWTPMEPETLPADGERVFVSNGTDVAIAEFVVDANGRRLEFVILPAEGTITHWRPLSDMELP